MRLRLVARLLTEQNLKHNMEEKIIRTLNWYYYGVMVVSLIVLSVMYYLLMHQMYTPIDPMSELGTILQTVAIAATLLGIVVGLYLIKWRKPETLEQYKDLAIGRILTVGGTMPMSLCFFYLLGGYRPLMWIAAMAAVAWYFTKPTLGKMEEEMKPKDPNEETY